jgi:flagellar motor protein MotB
MFEQDEKDSVGSYWPSVTDLFMTLFIIAIVILGAVSFVLLPKNNVPALEQVQIAVGKDFIYVIKPINRLREEVGLDPVRYRGASQVIEDLEFTVESAIKLLSQLRKNDPSGMTQKIKELETRILELENTIKSLREQLDRITHLETENKKLKFENKLLKSESPNLVIDEREQEFRFDSGSPVIKDDFALALRRKLGDSDKLVESGAPFPNFAAKIIESPDRFNTLEIIGHTDGVPLTSSGNIDQRLPYILTNQLAGSSKLKPGSNNDLGLLRALALKQEWLEYVDTYPSAEHRKLLRKIEIRCYSAGQTILPIRVNSPKPSDFTKDDPRARRIEMRLTRLGVFSVDSDTNRTD